MAHIHLCTTVNRPWFGKYRLFVEYFLFFFLSFLYALTKISGLPALKACGGVSSGESLTGEEYEMQLKMGMARCIARTVARGKHNEHGVEPPPGFKRVYSVA